MKKIIATILLTVIYCAPSLAGNSGFIPRVSIGFSDFSLTQGARPNLIAPGSEFPEVAFDVTFFMVGVGGTFFVNNLYLDLSFQQSNDQDDTFNFEGAPGGTFSETFEGDRQDYAMTTGVKFFEGKAGIFGGYKVGKSEAAGTRGTTLEFEEDGFFLGANYIIPVAEAGIISLNFAFAWLDGDLNEKATPLFGDAFSINANSDATGISYGIAWASSITEKINYALSFDANQYDFKNVVDNSRSALPPSKFEEEFFTLKFTLSYRF